MTAGPSATSLEPVLLVIALALLIMVRRALSMIRGAPVRPAALFGFAAFYVFLFAFIVGLSAAITPWYLLVLDAAIVVVTAVLATGYLRDHVRLERRATGEWTYRLHPWVPIVYMGLFITRIAVSAVVLGPSVFDFSPASSGSLTLFDRVLLDLVDALFAFSTGLLVGRSSGVYLAYRNVRAAPAPPRSTGPA